MMIHLTLVVFACCSAVCSAAYSFLSVGDWGGAAIGAQEVTNVYSVSAQMDTTATSLNAQFVLNTGDSKCMFLSKLFNFLII
ncbi:hypothetical protein EON65_17565 [archaeon]|nr:MAG: hypothetical protein EON65_17565 [archaeon]